MYGFEFNGRSTEALEVLEQQTLDSVGAIPEDRHEVLVNEWRPYLGDDATVAGVLSLTDDGALKLYRCRVSADGGAVEVYTGWFGDTLAGLVVRDGVRVARISDGEVLVDT